MPRRSSNAPDVSPAPRRTSARIAAVIAASPAKSPAKPTPRRKRQSAEMAKAASEDTESQQSQVKSEVSLEELNGLDTSSSTKDAPESIDLPSKKVKLDSIDQDVQEEEEMQEPLTTKTPPVTPDQIDTSMHSNSGTEQSESHPVETEPVRSTEPIEPETKSNVSIPEPAPISPTEFEVVEKSDLPAPDSAEVKAAVAVQGEDGHLLAGFVQVNKDELPAATSIKVKQVTPTEECESRPLETIPEVTESLAPPAVTECVAPINGDSHEEPSNTEPPQNDVVMDEPAPTEVLQGKSLPSGDMVPPHMEQAAGDITSATNIEPISHQL